MLVPEPETPLFDALRHTLQRDGYASRYNAWLASAADEQLIRDHPDIFSSYYYYPGAMPRARYIFAVETVELLRRADPVVIDYALRAFQGRLSLLVERFLGFVGSNGFDPLPDREALEAFFSTEFGPGHHVASLFRWALRTDEAPREAMPPDVHNPLVTYALSPAVHILHNIHDCAFVLKQIQSAVSPEILDDSQCGERRSFILRSAGEASAYAPIDRGAEAILKLFQSPRTLDEVARYLCSIAAADSLDPEFFRPWIDAGILIAVPPNAEPLLMETNCS